MPVEIKKGLLGGYSIGYDCPYCQARLKSSLDDAGKTDNCPECRREFVVPGVEQRDQINAQAETNRKQKALNKQQAAAERSRLREEARQRAEAMREEERQKAEARRQEAAQLEKQWAESQAAMEAKLGPVPRKLGPNDIICPNPNCGYVGPPREVARGSTAVGCLLCFIMLLPGLIYFIFMSDYDIVCPRCGLQIRSRR